MHPGWQVIGVLAAMPSSVWRSEDSCVADSRIPKRDSLIPGERAGGSTSTYRLSHKRKESSRAGH